MVDSEESEYLRRPSVSVPRVIWVSVIWFSVAVLAVAITMGLLLSSGWRPSHLHGADQIVWWIGAAATAISLPFIGWSGCPILANSVYEEHEAKNRTLPIGLVLFMTGGTFAMLALLLGPA